MLDIFLKFSTMLKNLCFPPSCYVCGEFTDTNGLCANCWKNIKWISEPKCEICSSPFSIPTQKICADCMKKHPHFDKTVSVFVYDNYSRKMILLFKNGDCTYMTPQFARWMYRVAEKDLHDADMIIPVPISMEKRLKRKYNQAELLSMELAKLSKIVYEPRILVKQKNTRPQEGLSRISREKNLSGSFGISGKYSSLLSEKNVVLVDDVMTTGSTANECSKVLKKHGVKHITVLTVARVTIGERVSGCTT